MIKLTPPILFMSDVHLMGHPQDQYIIDCIESQIASHPEHIRTLVFVGDLFDFNLGYKHTIYSCFFHFYHYLALWKSKGIEIHIFTGNHDPDPCLFLRDQLGVIYHEHATVFKVGSSSLYIEHGDAQEKSWFKRKICHLVRAPIIRRCARLIPSSWSYWLVKMITRPTKPKPSESNFRLPFHQLASKDPYTFALLNDLLHKWLNAHAHKVDIWMIGHFHQAYLFKKEGSSPRDQINHSRMARFVCLGEWIQLYTFARWNEGTSESPLKLYQYDPIRQSSALLDETVFPNERL